MAVVAVVAAAVSILADGDSGGSADLGGVNIASVEPSDVVYAPAYSSAKCRDSDLAIPSKMVDEAKELLAKEMYADAEAMFNKALDLLSNRCYDSALAATAWDNLATIYDKMGLRPQALEAKEHYRKITQKLK